MSKRQIRRIFPGTTFINRKFTKLQERLISQSGKCIACGTKNDLEPHHIVPCNVYDKLFLDENNIAIFCRSCHNRYHATCFPINNETFDEFCSKKHHPKGKKKKKQKFSRKKYESSPLYSKIKINDFTKSKKPEKKVKKNKRRKRRRKKLKRLNPIFLSKNLGTDDWDYMQKIQLEKEILGDYI